MCRFVLIPFFFYGYVEKNFLLAAILFFVAGITDVLDGIIARKFNMTTDLGKIIDPLADKLMHICAIALLAYEFHQLIFLLVILCVKEILQIIGGLKLMKDKMDIMPSKWYGKINTAILFVFMSLLIWRGYGSDGHIVDGVPLGGGIPLWICHTVLTVIVCLTIYAFINYYIEGFKGAYKRAAEKAALSKEEKKEEKAEKKAEKELLKEEKKTEKESEKTAKQ